MIAINGLSKKFGSYTALDNITLSFNKGECIALIGPNGCGKTTLIKSILGMVIPDKGEIHFNNISIHNQYKYRSDIGYMPQIGRYPENMTIGQTIEMIKHLRENKSALDEELIVEYQMTSILDKRMRTLSGGTRQKVSACLAFLFNPSVLFLDEPTAGLDPISAEKLKNKINREIANGKLIIITSHQLAELDDMITELIFMQDGKIKFHSKVSELLKNSNETRISKAIIQILNKESQ